MTDPTPAQIPEQISRALLDAVKDFREFMAGPVAPDAEVRAWKLYSGAEYGGVYCAQPECGCEGHGSEILPGGWPGDDEDDATGTFTLDELHRAIGEHILWRAEARAEEAEATA